MDEAAARELYEKHAPLLTLRLERYERGVFAYCGLCGELRVDVHNAFAPDQNWCIETLMGAPHQLDWLMDDYPRGKISNLETEEQWAWGRGDG